MHKLTYKQKSSSSYSQETMLANSLEENKEWLVRVGKKLKHERRLTVKPPSWEEAKLDKGLDAISFLFKSYRVCHSSMFGSEEWYYSCALRAPGLEPLRILLSGRINKYKLRASNRPAPDVTTPWWMP